jgi:hypothetical protein
VEKEGEDIPAGVIQKEIESMGERIEAVIKAKGDVIEW